MSQRNKFCVEALGNRKKRIYDLRGRCFDTKNAPFGHELVWLQPQPIIRYTNRFYSENMVCSEQI